MSGKPDPAPLPRLPDRPPDSHKGHFGRALLVGGSRGLAGAIGLAGMGALRSGAGLVTLAVPVGCQATVAGYEPSYMTVGLPEDDAGRLDLSTADLLRSVPIDPARTVLAVGPGMGRSDNVRRLVHELYRQWPGALVVDADGLNALAGVADVLLDAGGPRVLTPHPGELVRLVAGLVTGGPGKDSPRPGRAVQVQWAVEAARRCGTVVVLKGHATVVTDGGQCHENSTGNPGMATGGSGDVLTGVVAALLCQGLGPLDAARLAVHVHGLAGDLAAGQLGQIGLVASDLAKYLPAAFRQLEERTDT